MRDDTARTTRCRVHKATDVPCVDLFAACNDLVACLRLSRGENEIDIGDGYMYRGDGFISVLSRASSLDLGDNE